MLLSNLTPKFNFVRLKLDSDFVEKKLLFYFNAICFLLLLHVNASGDIRKDNAGEYIHNAPANIIFDRKPQDDLRLIGMQLEQAGQSLYDQDDVITINPQELLEIKLHWLPGHDINTKLPVVLQFSTRDGVVKRTIEIQIGPESGSIWKAGGLYQHHHIADMRSITRSFSGAATLSTFLGLENSFSQNQICQQIVNLRLLPLIEPPNMETERYPEFFGTNYISLNKRFRLGSGVTQRIDIKNTDNAAIIGIGLISSFGYNSVPQTKIVAMCRVYSNDQKLVELPILSGIHTARSDYDFDPQRRDHQKIAIIESEEADYLDTNGAPFLRHKYVSKLPSTELALANSIEFEMLVRGTLDIFDVVLLMDEDST